MTGSDDRLFREAMQDVAPLKQNRVERGQPRSSPTPGQQQRRDAAEGKTGHDVVDDNPLTLGQVPPVHPRETLAWKKDGVQHQVFAKLKSGRYRIDAELDLHRRTVREAREDVRAFIDLARARGWRAVRITHGRGEQSAEPARLKRYVNAWLMALPDVIAFHSALPNQGGTGSAYVLLRKSPAQKALNRERYGLKGNDTP